MDLMYFNLIFLLYLGEASSSLTNFTLHSTSCIMGIPQPPKFLVLFELNVLGLSKYWKKKHKAKVVKKYLARIIKNYEVLVLLEP